MSIDLKKYHWKAVLFGDGAKGSAFQMYECVEEPRLSYIWSRKDREDLGTIEYYVDCIRVSDLNEAAKRLEKPARQRLRDIKSPAAELEGLRRKLRILAGKPR